MNPFRLLALYRHPKFSNNAIEADRLILEEAVKSFQRFFPRPVSVDFLEESQIESNKNSYHLVLTMAQSADALASLDRQKELLPIVWNSTQAIRNCYRVTMSKKLESAGIGYAPFFLVRNWQELENIFEDGSSYWLKRGDFHAINDDDVTLAESRIEAKVKMENFATKGVVEVIVQKHIVGDIYKFYGVNSGFFTAIRVRKFLTEDISFSETIMKERCKRAAELLGLQIYGGDFILDANGEAHIIDVNDWPSFRICREAAADAIGRYAASFIQKAQDTHPAKSRTLS
jgi:hypothetical protein